MRSKYAGEKSKIIGSVDGWGTIHEHFKPTKEKKVHVLYMSAQKAAQYEICYNTEQLQWERNSKPLPDGTYSIVINTNWKMLAFSDADVKAFNVGLTLPGIIKKIVFKHSTLTQGDDVLFGGTGTLEKGRFTWDEQSGHYRPEPKHVATCRIWQLVHGVRNSTYIKYTKETNDKKENKFRPSPSSSPPSPSLVPTGPLSSSPPTPSYLLLEQYRPPSSSLGAIGEKIG
jgi:plasmid maintenance system killer protein